MPVTRLWALPVTVLLFLLAWHAHCYPDRLSTGRIDRVILLEPGVGQDPGAGQAGRQIELPHRWRTLEGSRTEAWYTARIELDADKGELWAVLLPAVSMSASVYVNDKLIGGRTDGEARRLWNYPQYLHFPDSLLRAGVNDIDVHVLSDTPGKGSIAPFHVGTDAELRQAFWLMRFFRVTLAEIIVAFSATVTLFMAVLWLQRRRDTIYGWFALAIGTWTVHNLYLLVRSPPVLPIFWDWIWYVSVGFFVILVVVFIHRFLRYDRPRVERTLFVTGITGAVILAVLAFIDPRMMHLAGVYVWDAAATSLGLYPAVMMIQASLRRSSRENQILLVSGLLILAFGAHDWMVLAGILHCDNGLIMHLSAPVVIGAFGWILLKRFVAALDESETLNRRLEERVAQRGAEIARKHEEILRLEKRETLALERERIMLDMHDGVGGQLISLLSLAESQTAPREHIVQGLHDAMDELRLTIDSLDPSYTDLGAALSFLRRRMVPRLRSAGLEVGWPPASAVGAKHALKPSELLQVVRILQEALINVLKHADAARIDVAVRTEEQGDGRRLVLEVVDDGSGLDPQAARGRGLSSMHRRARSLGGRLEIDASPSGTRVRISLPVA